MTEDELSKSISKLPKADGYPNHVATYGVEAHNKACAEALGWGVIGNSVYIPKEIVSSLDMHDHHVGMSNDDCYEVSISNLRFHDSYDWSHLIIAECGKRGINKHKLNDEILKRMNEDDYVATPLQISQACLEVLNG